MQDKRNKSIKEFFRSKYVQAVVCYSLPSCALYFGAMLAFRKTIEADIYLVLNLVVPAVLCFFLGLAVRRWAEKTGRYTMFAIKITLAVVALVLVDQVVQVVTMQNLGVTLPIVGDWVAVGLAERSGAYSIIPGVSIPPSPPWFNLLMIPLCIIAYRAICFENLIYKRLVAIWVSLAIAMVLSLSLSVVLRGEVFNFMAVRNFVGFGVLDIFAYLLVAITMHCMLVDATHEVKTKALPVLKAYFKYEADNVKALVASIHRSKQK